MATSKKAAAKKVAPKKAIPVVAKKVNVDAKTTPIKNMPHAIFNIDEINSLINAVNQSNVNELKLEKGDFKITIRQGGVVVASTPQSVVVPSIPASPTVIPAAPAPVASPVTPAASPASVADASADNVITIKSPMIGTFYRAAGPGKPVFVNVGDDIKAGQVLCIVEAMKLFNEIESEVSGKIVKVLVDDASPIEYDQPLFLVQPA